MKWLMLTLTLTLTLIGCTTTFLELRGECVMQQWQIVGYVVRKRMLCDLPPPTLMEGPLREREAMSTNPFPNLWDFRNKADTAEPDLLEEHMEYPEDE